MSGSITRQKAEWIARVLGVASRSASSDEAIRSALAGWQNTRADCVATLTALESAIRGMAHPRANAAIILVRAIRANLTPMPTTSEQVAELERYVATDEILADAEAPNGFGIKVSLRAPLQQALAALRDAHGQGGTRA